MGQADNRGMVMKRDAVPMEVEAPLEEQSLREGGRDLVREDQQMEN